MDAPNVDANAIKDVMLKNGCASAFTVFEVRLRCIWLDAGHRDARAPQRAQVHYALCVALRARPPARGDRVAVLWPADGCWYEGVVERVSAGGALRVSYDDGDLKWVTGDHLQWMYVSRAANAGGD